MFSSLSFNFSSDKKFTFFSLWLESRVMTVETPVTGLQTTVQLKW